MFQEISNEKQFWCSQKLAGRLVGHSSRWYQGNLASQTDAVLPGQGGHFLLHKKHRSASTTQVPKVSESNIEFILEIEFGNWEIKATEGTIYNSTSAVHRGHRQGCEKVFVCETKLNFLNQPRIPDGKNAPLFRHLDTIPKSRTWLPCLGTFHFPRKSQLL